jgi:competence protein ComEA
MLYLGVEGDNRPFEEGNFLGEFAAKLIERLKGEYSLVLKVALGVVLVVAAGLGVVYVHAQRSTPALLIGDESININDIPDVNEYTPTEQVSPNEAASVIMVYVSGHVVNPGVFALYEGARINDAVKAAGGMTETADPNAVNLAAFVLDEQHIIVFGLEDGMPPSIMGGSFGSAGNSASGAGGSITADGRININTATIAELTTLNGIGEVRAEAIIRHRDARGGFERIEEIMNVSGIGESIFAAVKDRIFID